MSKKKFILFFLINSFILFSLESYKIHEVKDGETLWRISKLYNVSIETLCNVNKIVDVTKVKKGSKLKIPITNDKSNFKEKKCYLDYNLPLKGNIKLLVTSNFRGIIIFNDNNKEVIAIDDGTVIHVDNLKGYGLTIFIKGKNDLILIYSGFDRVYIKKNEKVKKFQPLGMNGIISRYSKYGLIFSIQKDGKYLKYDFEKNKFYYTFLVKS